MERNNRQYEPWPQATVYIPKINPEKSSNVLLVNSHPILQVHIQYGCVFESLKGGIPQMPGTCQKEMISDWPRKGSSPQLPGLDSGCPNSLAAPALMVKSQQETMGSAKHMGGASINWPLDHFWEILGDFAAKGHFSTHGPVRRLPNGTKSMH